MHTSPGCALAFYKFIRVLPSRVSRHSATSEFRSLSFTSLRASSVRRGLKTFSPTHFVHISPSRRPYFTSPGALRPPFLYFISLLRIITDSDISVSPDLLLFLPFKSLFPRVFLRLLSPVYRLSSSSSLPFLLLFSLSYDPRYMVPITCGRLDPTS